MTFHPHPLLFPLAGLVAGSLIPSPTAGPTVGFALALAIALAAIAILTPRRGSLAGLVVAAAAAGSALSGAVTAENARFGLPPAIAGADGPVRVQAVIETSPILIDDQIRFDARAWSITHSGVESAYAGHLRFFVRVGERPADRDLRKGDRISAWADLRTPLPLRSPGGFDQSAWAAREGIHALASVKNLALVTVLKASAGDWNLIDRARERLRASWRHVPDPADRAIVASMIVGDEGALDATTREEFRAAGLLHLLVVSGSQVAALIVGVRRLLSGRLRRAWSGCAIECSALLVYCAVAGGEDSILRATLMAMAFAVGMRVDLERAGLNALFAAALALLCLRPLDAMDPGAQLSFAAAAALVMYASPVARALESRRVPGLLAEILAATFVATIATAPLSVIWFHRISVVGFLANLIAAPLGAPLLYGSLLTAGLDLLSPALAGPAGALCGGLASALAALAHAAAAVDPDWRLPAPHWTLLVGALAAVLARGFRRRLLPAAGLLAALTLTQSPSGDGRLHLWFLDVGQGDAILIETPGGRALVIDAGPAFDAFDAGERIVAPAIWALGYRKIERLGITHRHADHAGGAPFLTRHLKPARVLVNGESAPLASFDPTIATRGDRFALDGVSFEVLSPDPSLTLPARDENSRSLVFEVRYGATAFLLTGDVSARVEATLPRRRYDVLKVAHHGAGTSSSEAFVRTASPRLAVVSVGARNRFSHPNPAVIARWSASGARVWRTDVEGTLHVASDGRGVTWNATGRPETGRP